MRYLSLVIISIPLSIILLLIAFGFAFYGSLIGIGFTVVAQLGMSSFLYLKIKMFRLRYFAAAFGTPLFLGVVFWAYLLLKESNNSVFGLLGVGFIISYGIPQLVKIIIDKYLKNWPKHL